MEAPCSTLTLPVPLGHSAKVGGLGDAEDAGDGHVAGGSVGVLGQAEQGGSGGTGGR